MRQGAGPQLRLFSGMTYSVPGSQLCSQILGFLWLPFVLHWLTTNCNVGLELCCIDVKVSTAPILGKTKQQQR